MAEENQLAGNLLQTQEEADRKAAAQGQTPASTQPVYNPLLGVSERQFMQIMAGNDPSKPMISTDSNGVPQFHFENFGQNTPTQVKVNQYGQVDVPAVREAMKQNAEQISQELEDFHVAFAPELAKDNKRSSYFNEVLQAVPQFISETGKSGGSIVMHGVHGILAQNRNFQEAKWATEVAANAEDPDLQLAGAQVKQWEDAGYSGMAIANTDVDDLNLPEKSKKYLKDYQKLVASRISDERRMRIAMAYDQDKTWIQDAMQNSKYLTAIKPYGGDEDTTINTIAKMSGQVAGSVAVFYLTGRAVGLAGATAGRARGLLAGANSAEEATKAVQLAQAGGTDAFLTAAANIGEKYVFLPSFMNQYDSIRTQSLLAGKSIAEANAIGFVAGVAEGSLEFAGFKWFKRFYTDGGWFKNYVIRNIIPESLQEGSQTLAENTITQLTGVTDKQWEDIMAEVGLSIIAGAMGGGMFSFWRAKTLGADAWAANLAEELGNKWGGLTKEQINQVVNVTNQAMEANEAAGKATNNAESVFTKPAQDTKGSTQQYLEAYKSLSAEQKTAAKEYLDAVNQLKDHYTKRVKENNPKVSEAQLRNGWKHVRAQVLAQKDSNLLVQTYENSINQAVAYLKPDSEVVKHNTKIISDKLFSAGYTQEQINGFTDPNYLKAHDNKWKAATEFIIRRGKAMGLGDSESQLLANTIKTLAYDASLVSPGASVDKIVGKIMDHMLNVQVAILHGQRLPVLFNNIIEEIKPENFASMSEQEKIKIAADIIAALEADARGEGTDKEISTQLFGDASQADNIERLKSALFNQAEIIKNVIPHMPLNRTNTVTDTDYRVMALLKRMGLGWGQIIPAFVPGGKNTEMTYAEAFEETSKEYAPKLTDEEMSWLEEMDDYAVSERITPSVYSNLVFGTETTPEYIQREKRQGLEKEDKPVYSDSTIEKMQNYPGFYEAQTNQAVLTAPKIGTGLHEGTHLSFSRIVTNAIKLEKAGLLSDLSPIHRIYSYLRQATKINGLELTETQLQETINDAVNDFITKGQSKDPVITGLLNQMKAQGYQRYKNLLGSKYSNLSKEGKEDVKAFAEDLVSGITPGTMLSDAYRLQQQARLEEMPEDFNSSDQTSLSKWGEQLKDFIRKYPIDAELEEMMIDKAVESGNAILLAQTASSISTKAIEMATDSFLENKGASEQDTIQDEQIMFEADAAALTPENSKQVLENLGFRKQTSIMDDVKNIEWSKSRGIFAQGVKNLFQSLEGAAGELDEALGKNGKAKGQMRSLIMRQFYDYGVRLQSFRETAKPMVDALDKHMEKFKYAARDAEALEWYTRFHLVLRQGAKGAYKKAGDFLESKLGKEARKSYDNSIKKLAEAKEMMIQAGVPANLLGWEGDFFPFAVKDYNRFVTEFLEHSHAFANNEKERARFIEEYKKKHPQETEENMTKLYVLLVDNQNALFQRNADNETKVTSFHKRSVKMKNDEDPTIFEYYKDPFDSLDNYMETAYRTVMMRNLIGRVTYDEDGKPILMHGTGQVGSYLARIPEGAVPAEVLDNFTDKMKALAARDAGDQNTMWDIMRQVNQMTTLGSFFNAMNQVMDMPFILTMFGPKAVEQAMSEMMSKAGESLTLEDIGAQNLNEVFRVQDESVLAKATKKVFKWTGFEWTDRKIKEVAINAAAKWAQNTLKTAHTGTNRQAADNSQNLAELNYVIDECFPQFDMNMIPPGMSREMAEAVAGEMNERRNDMLKAMENGGKNEDGSWNNDAKYVYWYLLTKLQPINAATVSANYNRHGAFAKSMYQFSTVATRQMGFIADFWRMKMQTGGAKQAVLGMVQFIGFCMAIGMPKEVIEAVLKGREPDVAGSFVMSPLHVIMLNEYTLSLAKREGIPSALFRTYSAKFNLGDNLTRDIIGFLSGKDFKFNTSKNIPILGAFMYAWMFGGKEQTIKQGKDLFGRVQDPEKARKVREANRQKEASLTFMEEEF